MPNFLYGSARSKFLWGGISWTTQNFGILFLNGSAATGGSANLNAGLSGSGTVGVGTTGWQGIAGTPTPNTGPFLSDIQTGWRARGAASIAGTAMDLDSKSYYSGTGVTATPFVPAGGSAIAATIDGAARGNNVTFGGVAQSFGTLTAFVLYRNTGAENTSDLVAYFDVATNLPIPCNGGDITIQWSTAANLDYIFKL